MKRLCPQHGLVEAVFDGTCAVCGAPSLDPDDPANRETIRSQRSRRLKEGAGAALIALLMFGFVFAPVILPSYTKNTDLIAFVPLACLIAGGVFIAIASSRGRPIIPGARLRFWTSTTVISAGVCLVFVGIKRTVGIDTLWFGSGYFAEPWRIVTASFTHGGAVHLGGNMIALAVFGPPIDFRIGRLRTAVVLAAAAVGGACAQAVYSTVPMVGFSAAIYGLFGATLALMPRRPQLLSISMVAIPMPTWAWMIVTVPLYTLIVAFDKSSNVAWIAHLGGFVAGLAVALPMRRVPEFVAREAERKARFDAVARQSPVGDLTDVVMIDEPAPYPDATSTPEVDAEVAEFHRAARRRQVVVLSVGGGSCLVIGLAVTALAASMEAPERAQGRKIGVITLGLTMTLAGGGMLRQAVRYARQRPLLRAPEGRAS